MKTPNSQLSEVLFELLRKRKVSHRNFQMQDFRKKISVLKLEYGLNLKRELVTDVTRYGNHYQYGVHYLEQNDRDKAVEIYNKLVN
jgi:hypothetical protein